MKKKKFYPLAAILFTLSMVVVAGGLYWFDVARRQPIQANSNSQVPDRQVNQTELASADGKDGNKCYVAVDGVVYEIIGSSLWLNGSHVTSAGKASCGRDLSEVIKQSPHGKIYLNLPVVHKVGKLV